MLNKTKEIFKEIIYLIKKEKAYFIAPLLILFGILAIFIFQVGPSVIIAFIYAGL